MSHFEMMVGYQRYFSFIRAVLGGEEAFRTEWRELDWEAFFLFCQRQSIGGLVFEGIKQYHDGLKDVIDIELLMNWFSLAGQIEEQNKLINKRAAETVRLFASEGFRSCILKGQGNTFAYPNVYCRAAGDIDIWVDGSREEINSFVKGRCPDSFEQEHHIEFPVFDDAIVEVHYKPSSLIRPQANKEFQVWYEEQKEIQMSHKGILPDGAGEICYPTNEFNVIYQLSHIMSHFFVEGIGLRHFIDYYYVLKNFSVRTTDKGGGQSSYDGDDITVLLKRFGMFRFAQGVMWIERECLGIEQERLIVAPDEKIGKVILTEMMEGGNFGHYDERYRMRKRGYLFRGAVDVYRLLRLTTVFPVESFWKIMKKVGNQRWKMRKWWLQTRGDKGTGSCPA